VSLKSQSEDYKDIKMASYVYTAGNAATESANIATDKVRIATTSAIHYETGFPETTGTGNLTTGTTSATVTGNGTAFTTELNIGYWIGNTTGSTVGVVQTITNDETLTLSANAEIELSDEGFTYSPYGVPYVQVTANSAIIPANTVNNSIIVGQGNVVAYLEVDGVTSAPFSITELGMPHANTGTSGY
jgi:hypothetical protein